MKTHWSEAEQWAWEAITSGPHPGNVADLAQHFRCLPPVHPLAWTDRRLVLSTRFLQDILTDPSLQPLVTLHGVHLKHAIFPDYVDLAHIRLNHKLRFDRCSFAQEINLEDVEITSWLSFAGSVFRNAGAEFRLRGSRLRELDLVEVASLGSITMDGVRVEGHVLLQRLRCPKTIDIVFAQIDGSVDLSEAVVNEVNLSSSRTGELRFGAVGVEDGQGQGQTRWLAASSRLTLANTEASSWQDGGKDASQDEPESLTDPFLGPITLAAWPARLQLSGFSYQHLGGYSYAARRTPDPPGRSNTDPAAKPRSMLTRDVGYFTRLLQRDRSQTMQPFRQLAGVLRQTGYPAKADTILYDGLEAERERARGLRWLWLSCLKCTIGYGVGGYTWRVVWVVAAITGFGTAVLSGYLSHAVWMNGTCCPMDAPTAADNVRQLRELRNLPSAVVYSFHQLVPFFELNPKLDDIVLPSCLQVYFYLHKIAGWFLGSVLVAAAAGLTQRRE